MKFYKLIHLGPLAHKPIKFQEFKKPRWQMAAILKIEEITISQNV